MVAELHAYWDRKRAGRPMPRRADIDPSDLRRLLPNIIIVELKPEPFRVLYRLAGTTVTALSGVELSGRHLDELIPADLENRWEACYRTVWSDRSPLYGAATVPIVESGTYRYEFAIFPLTRHGDSVDQCIAIEDYGDLNRAMSATADGIARWRPRHIKLKGGD